MLMTEVTFWRTPVFIREKENIPKLRLPEEKHNSKHPHLIKK